MSKKRDYFFRQLSFKKVLYFARYRLMMEAKVCLFSRKWFILFLCRKTPHQTVGCSQLQNFSCRASSATSALQYPSCHDYSCYFHAYCSLATFFVHVLCNGIQGLCWTSSRGESLPLNWHFSTKLITFSRQSVWIWRKRRFDQSVKIAIFSKKKNVGNCNSILLKKFKKTQLAIEILDPYFLIVGPTTNGR